MLNPYIIAGALLLSAATGVQGYRMGADSNEAKHVAAVARLQRDLFQTADRLSATSAALESFRAEQTQIAMEAEDAASADPDAANRRPSPDSLLRLKQRWRAGNTAP